MVKSMIDTRLSQASKIENLFRYFESKYEMESHLREKLMESPSVRMLDRLTAFRSDPWYYELRAALDRIEKGSYGVCRFCEDAISATKLERLPTSRLCEDCLAGVGLGDLEV